MAASFGDCALHEGRVGMDSVSRESRHGLSQYFLWGHFVAASCGDCALQGQLATRRVRCSVVRCDL